MLQYSKPLGGCDTFLLPFPKAGEDALEKLSRSFDNRGEIMSKKSDDMKSTDGCGVWVLVILIAFFLLTFLPLLGKS